MEQTRAAGPEIAGEPYETISALLNATEVDGSPDYAKRLEGAELALTQIAGESADEETLLEGVVLVYPTRA